MGIETHDQSPEVILERLDAIIRELGELRQFVVRQINPPIDDVAGQLFGALGQGSWDEYDQDLDWQRFEG